MLSDYNKPEHAIELHRYSNKKEIIEKNFKIRQKIRIPGQNRNLYGKIFASRNSPDHVEAKYILIKKPDIAPKIRILASGENPGYKKP